MFDLWDNKFCCLLSEIGSLKNFLIIDFFSNNIYYLFVEIGQL